jgi:ATP-binding cassette subfamily C exporter for protease/lipase
VKPIFQKSARDRKGTHSGDLNSDELTKAVQAQRPVVVRAIFFGSIAQLLLLAPVVYMFQIYGRVVESKSYLTMFWLIVAVALAYFVMEMLEWVRAEMLRTAAIAFDNALAPRVFQAMFALNRARGSSGQIQPAQDLRAVKEFMYSPVLMAMLDAPMALIFLVLVFVLHPLLGLITLLAALLQLALGLYHGRRTSNQLVMASRASMASQQYASSALRHAHLIEAMGMYNAIQERWRQSHEHYLQKQRDVAESSGTFQTATKTMQLLLSSALLGLGAWILLDGTLPGGSASMIVASTLGGRVLAPIGILVAQWRTFVQTREAWFRLIELLDTYTEHPAAMALPPPSGQLVVEALIAAAPASNAPILRGVQFRLNPGEALAVIGPSGSGKTTLARMLVGLWGAMSGKVRLDGADVFTWNKTELGPNIGYLPQSVELIDGSLAENIARFGVLDVEKIKKAAQCIGLHDWIMELPQGYDTAVGRDGVLLSGGQAQRVGLARAVYGEPKFVVLDEPSSSLDQAGEQQLIDMVTALKKQGVTFVLTTHRKNLIEVADKALVLRDGVQQSFGPRDEVMVTLMLQAGGA